MDLASFGTVLGLITSLVTLTIWAWSLIKNIRIKVAEARAHAGQGEKLAQQLVASATSAEKRADIYLYISLKAIESSERRTNALIVNSMFAVITVLIAITFVWSSKTLEIDYKHPAMITLYVTLPMLFISWGVLNWFNQILRMLDISWHSGVNQVLIQKIGKHVA